MNASATVVTHSVFVLKLSLKKFYVKAFICLFLYSTYISAKKAQFSHDGLLNRRTTGLHFERRVERRTQKETGRQARRGSAQHRLWPESNVTASVSSRAPSFPRGMAPRFAWPGLRPASPFCNNPPPEDRRHIFPSHASLQPDITRNIVFYKKH